MTSLYVICGLGPLQSKILAKTMITNDVIVYALVKFSIAEFTLIFGEVWLCFVFRVMRPLSKVETNRASSFAIL